MANRAQLKPGEVSLGQTQEFIISFGKQGGNVDLLQKAIERPAIMARVVEAMSSVSASQKMAKLIMGSNFRSLMDVEFAFSHKFTKSELKVLENIPYSEEVLTECRDTHLLIPYFETTLWNIKASVPEATYKENDWFMSGNPFAKNERTQVGWVLMMKECVMDSFNKTYEEQIALLPATYENPQAVDFFYMLALEVKLQRDQILLKYWNDTAWGKTKSLDAGGDRVCAALSEGRVDVFSDSGGATVSHLGLVGLRKFE